MAGLVFLAQGPGDGPTFILRAGSWRVIPPAPSDGSPPLSNPTMAWDDCDKYLLYADERKTSTDPATGLTRATLETWIFDGHGWARVPSADMAVRPGQSAVGYDDRTHQMLLIAQFASEKSYRTFTWDRGHWSALSGTNTPSGFDAFLVDDPGTGLIARAAEQMWRWNGVRWQAGLAEPCTQCAFRLGADHSSHRLVALDIGPGRIVTYTFDGSSWHAVYQPIGADMAPYVELGATTPLAWDESSGEIVTLVTGHIATALTPLAWDGRTWVLQPTAR